MESFAFFHHQKKWNSQLCYAKINIPLCRVLLQWQKTCISWKIWKGTARVVVFFIVWRCTSWRRWCTKLLLSLSKRQILWQVRQLTHSERATQNEQDWTQSKLINFPILHTPSFVTRDTYLTWAASSSSLTFWDRSCGIRWQIGRECFMSNLALVQGLLNILPPSLLLQRSETRTVKCSHAETQQRSSVNSVI